MGRGRAKAKQTKVARQLKYNSGGFDATRLADELGASDERQSSSERQQSNGKAHGGDEEAERDDDPYARYADMYNDDDDVEDEAGDDRRRA